MTKEQTDPAKSLLRWYNKHGRDLPWRKTREPYEIWVSEVILQQTQVVRGVDYYHRFLKKFPDLESLAKASWRNVLPVWRGLGYYRRGENMLKAAKIVVSDLSGKFPESKEELLFLPGIGEYTASAILSFAHNKPEPALDTNLFRVLMRYWEIPKEDIPIVAKGFFVAHKRSSAKLNQALMDIGAIFCGSRKTNCTSCPLHKDCLFYKSGEFKNLSETKKSKKKQRVDFEQEIAVACIHKNSKYLMQKGRRKDFELFAFPIESPARLRETLKSKVKEKLGIEISVRPSFITQEVGIIKKTTRYHYSRCQVLSGVIKDDSYQFIDLNSLDTRKERVKAVLKRLIYSPQMKIPGS